MKHEWRKQEKAVYLPKTKPEVIEVPEFSFFSIKGQGSPDSEEFQQCVEALYSASILLDAWETAAASASHREEPLGRAFRPAVILHLRRAYGWSLLAVSGADDETDPERLPGCVEDVPPPPVGRTVVPELREFELLEREGWVGDMLAAAVSSAGFSGTRAPGPDASRPAPGMQSASLLGSDRAPTGPGELRQWQERLTATLVRMDDLLAEC